jgi:predicted transcriptional regulator
MNITVYLTEDELFDELKELAEQQDRSISYVIREAIKKYLYTFRKEGE